MGRDSGEDRPGCPTMDGPHYTPDTAHSTSMAAEPISTKPPDADAVTCPACRHQIPDPDPVARCPSCGWQEMRGAD